MFFKKNKKGGFTLIELLVVVAIIGLLSSVVLVSLNTARTKAKDAKRLASVKQMQIAIELYYDTNGSYPVIQAYITPNGEVNWYVAFANLLRPYLPALPDDPPSAGYMYRSINSGQQYGLATGTDSGSHASLMANDGGFYNSYYEVGTAPAYCKSFGIEWWDNANCP